MVEKCDRFQDYNTWLEGQVTPFQEQVAKLQKDLGSSFKSSTFLKKKYDDQALALLVVHNKLCDGTTCHSSAVEQFWSIIRKLDEDLAHFQKDLENAKEATVAEYRDSEAFEADIADGSAETSEIAFFNLIGWLAHDHMTLDLSSYSLVEVLGVSTF